MPEGFQLAIVVDGGLVIPDAVQSRVGESGGALPADPLPGRGKLRLVLASN